MLSILAELLSKWESCQQGFRIQGGYVGRAVFKQFLWTVGLRADNIQTGV